MSTYISGRGFSSGYLYSVKVKIGIAISIIEVEPYSFTIFIRGREFELGPIPEWTIEEGFVYLINVVGIIGIGHDSCLNVRCEDSSGDDSFHIIGHYEARGGDLLSGDIVQIGLGLYLPSNLWIRAIQ